jgi:hypothetical protein
MAERIKSRTARPEGGLPGDGLVMGLGFACLGVAGIQGTLSTIHLAYIAGPTLVNNIIRPSTPIIRPIGESYDQSLVSLNPEQIRIRDETVNSWWKSVIAVVTSASALQLTAAVTKKSQERLDIRP